MESNLVCNHTNDYQNRTTREAGVRLFLITSMITDRIGRQEGNLPINQNNDKIWEKKETRYQLYVFIKTKNTYLLGEMRDNSARTWRVLFPHTGMTC